MKIQFVPNKYIQGSAMISVLIITLVVGGALATYLLLVSGESKFVARSQSWNSAMTIAESGMEEGLACVNKNVGQSGSLLNWTNAPDGWDTTNQTAYKALTWTYHGFSSGWLSTSGTIYHMRRYLDATNGYYDVYINNATNSALEMLSIGTADWTTYSSSGTTNVSVSIKSPPQRKIYMQVTASSQGGDNGLIADALSFKGNNVTIDSFNSAVSTNSIWQTGLFYHGANYGTWASTLSYGTTLPSRTANVHVATESSSINVGNANIYGYLNTAPGGTYSIGPQGSVGDLSWVHNSTSGLETGHFRDDMNQTFTSLSLPVTFMNSVQTNNWLPVTTYITTIPSNSWAWVSSITNLDKHGNPIVSSAVVVRIGGASTNSAMTGGILYTNTGSGWSFPNGDGTYSTYLNVIPNRPQATNNIYYAMASIGSDNLYVDSQYAVLYLTNGMSSPTLTINTNADLFIYSGGSITFGTTVNNTALARALTINDIAGNPITLTGSGNASGVSKMYIPSSSITLNGGGNNTYDIIGEIVCQSATFNGHFNLHFDESLATNSPAGLFVVSNWKEVQ